MCLMGSESYHKFWAVAKILGLKSALSSSNSGTCLLEIVPKHRHVGLWECPELSERWHSHNMEESRGLIA